MIALLKFRRGHKEQQNDEQQKQEQQIMEGMSTAGAIVLMLGIAGVFIFGYLIYQDEITYSVQNTLSFLAAGVGLIVSFVLLGLGLFGKMK